MTDYSLDRIGDRLSGTNLTEHERLLAEDDKVRVQWLYGAVAGAGNTDVIDIGASDGTMAEFWALHGHRVFTIERHDAHRERLSRLPVFSYHGDAWTAVSRLPRMPDATVVCAEVLEHLSRHDALNLIQAVCDRVNPRTVIVTAPNADCASFIASGRARRDWPDHQQKLTASHLVSLLHDADIEGRYGCAAYPIVGTLNDSIWTGAVCHRA